MLNVILGIVYVFGCA